MESKKFLRSIVKGLISSIIVTVVCLIILSMVMTKFDLSEKAYNISYVVVTCFGLVLGAVIAAKINGRRGWLMGSIIGICFFGFLMLFSSMVGAEVNFGLEALYKIGGCVTVGAIAGMLGVNL